MPQPLYLYCLLLACSCATTQAQTALNASVAPEPLPLELAINRALEYNLGLIVSRYATADAKDNIVIQEAAFDPELFGTLSTSESLSAGSSSSLDSTTTPETENRRARAGVDLRLSTGATVTLDSNISRNRSNNNAARNPDYSTEVGISLRQPLFKDAGRRVNLAPLARAKGAADQSIFQLRSEVLDVISATEIAYWNLAYRQAQRALIASSLELAKNLLEENRERERLGLITPLEVLQAETEYVNQQEDVIQADRAIEDAEDTLRRAMGSASFLDDLNEDIQVQVMPTTLGALRPMNVVVRDTILSDADAKIQEKTIELERIDQLLAQDETRPDLNLSADLDYRGRDDNGSRAYRGAYSANGYNWNLGLELRIPWGFREARARERQAGRSVEQATVQLADIKQQKALAARSAWRAVNSGLQRIEVTQQSLLLNEESFKQARARYGSGLIAYRLVLEAQRDFDRARSNYSSAVIDRLLATVRLSRIDGTILARNGFDWSLIDRLIGVPELETHPLLQEIENQP
jgi:outer membrane protein TolC